MLKGSRPGLRIVKMPRPRKVAKKLQSPSKVPSSIFYTPKEGKKLPPLHTRSPEHQPRCLYEDDLQRLEELMNKNCSARLGLLKVQARIMELDTHTALREGSPVPSPLPISPLKLPFLS